MTDTELKIELMKVNKFQFKRFKNHDRLYWQTPKMNLTGTLVCHVEEIPDQELRDHIMNNMSPK